MKRSHKGLWGLLALSFAAFFAMSFADDDIKIGPLTLRTPSMAQSFVAYSAPANHIHTHTHTSDPAQSSSKTQLETHTQLSTHKPDIPAPVDTTSQIILIFGDSMLEGLAPRLAAYCNHNGHTLYSVVWYSSTSETWGKSNRLSEYINRLKPTFIFVSLGANELFVKDISSKRDKYVKKIIADIGNIPFVWIGPPNWKPDTGINNLVKSNTPDGSFFLSDGMKFDRSKDGAHPTRSSAILWMDSVARWMPLHANHPIKMSPPSATTARPKRVFVHQPSEM